MGRGLAGLGTLLGGLGAILGGLGAVLVGLGAFLGPPGLVLGASWGGLGRSWGALGRSWRDLGAPKSIFQRSWLQKSNFQKTLKNMRKNNDFCRSWEARIALVSPALYRRPWVNSPPKCSTPGVTFKILIPVWGFSLNGGGARRLAILKTTHGRHQRAQGGGDALLGASWFALGGSWLAPGWSWKAKRARRAAGQGA